MTFHPLKNHAMHKISWLNVPGYIRVLSWLLHHANRKYKDIWFYKIKDRILSKYGVHRGYDVQFIEGKKCYSCKGSGLFYVGYRGEYDTCWNCHNGWYKRPVWNILSRLEFGKYTFHQPYARSFSKPENSLGIIEGYIEHDKSKYSDFSAFILFQVYDFKGYWKRYYNSITGFRLMWWLPRNYLRNAIYIQKYGIRKAIMNIREHRNFTL
jgi:hypothetical protein